MHKPKNIIGIDLGGTKLAGALFEETGEILQKELVSIAGHKGDGVAVLIFDLIRTLMQRAQQQAKVVTGIGISVPGIAFVDSGEVWAPNIPGWELYPLIATLQNKLNQPNIPILLESDRACYILGEQWKGRAQGCKDAIFMAIGTGIGAGILVNGNILRGSRDIAGAIGWMALSQPYQSNYTSCGDYEYHASGPGLVKVAKTLIAENKTYDGPLRRKGEDLTTYDIFEYLELGDPIAYITIEKAITYWGMAVANLVSIFNPEKIIFGGGVFGPASRFLDKIRAEAEKWAQPISMKQVRLEVSALGGEAGLIGAGFLVLNQQSK